MTIDDGLVRGAREAAEIIAPLAAQIETDRRLPAEAIAALVTARVFKLCVPQIYGGANANAATVLAIIEAISRADGSAGWCAMIGSTSGLMSRYLDEPLAREVFGADDAITCGVFAPMGRATPTEDGRSYRVSGRWPFASGCEHSSWRMGGTFVADDPTDIRSVLFRAEETRIHDTWDVSGLRGTGSHDFEVSEVVVPGERTFSLLRDTPKQCEGEGSAEGASKEPKSVVPFFGLLAAGVAAVGLGIARAALDGFIDLAKTKKPAGSKRTLSHRETIQLEVARAEARLGAARSLLFDAIQDEHFLVRPEDNLERRAKLRLAACHAATESASITSALYTAGGGSVIYAKHPPQRQFRDVHVVTQHVMVATTAATMAGRILLGVETDAATL